MAWFIEVRFGGRQVRTALLGSLGCVLGVVG